MAGVSARSIASAAGVAPSAISYNFGNIERLLSSAFESGAARTAAWLETRSLEIQALAPTAIGATQALEHVLIGWTKEARPLALLYQECLAASAGAGVGAQWTKVWRDFWLAAARTFGLGETDGRMLHTFFESEALYHLSNWSPALERAALGDMVEHFGATWLGAPARLSTGSLIRAERAAGARTHGSLAPGAFRIAEAAAEVVEDAGLAGLTHRKVAARAGVTTGAVTHHFRTIEDLVAGAVRGQVLTSGEDRNGGGDSQSPLTLDEFVAGTRLFETLDRQALADQPASAIVRRRRLFLASVHRPELASAGAVIRFSHGGTLRGALDRLSALPDGSSALHSAVSSRLLAGLWFACSGDETPSASRAAVADQVLARLIPGRGRIDR
jgi:AcrR family transcriptional regulator